MASSKTSATQRAAAPALAYLREPLARVHYDDAQMTPGKARVTCQIAWEIDAIARALPGMVPVDGSEDAPYLVRGVADRLCRLSEILMSVLGGSTEDVEDVALYAFMAVSVAAAPLKGEAA